MARWGPWRVGGEGGCVVDPACSEGREFSLMVMTRHTRCVVTVPARRFESPRGSGRLPHSIRKQDGYGAKLTRADRSYPARGPRLWPCMPPRSYLGGRWPSRLVATAAEDRLSIKRNPHTSFAAASDCRTIAIYEYTPLLSGPFKSSGDCREYLETPAVP